MVTKNAEKQLNNNSLEGGQFIPFGRSLTTLTQYKQKQSQRSSQLEKESFLTEEDMHTDNNDENSPKFKAVSNSGTNLTGDHYEIKVKAADD